MERNDHYIQYTRTGKQSRNWLMVWKCRWLYNRLLEELNRAKENDEKLRMHDTNNLIPILKSENPHLCTVYSKVLQMVSQTLHYNISALAALKRDVSG